jgi:monofunctional biosynthetic peptidoglycan transglycosylase
MTADASGAGGARTARGVGSVVVDFGDPAEVASWRAIDDVVMGGCSSSALVPSGRGTALFTGVLSLANGGGFASVRSASTGRALAGALGLRVRFRADERRYRLRLRTSAAWDGIVYQAEFERARGARDGTWCTAELPFQDFVATYRGQRVPAAARLDPAAILSFGLMTAERQDGAFRLELAAIEACWPDARSASEDRR